MEANMRGSSPSKATATTISDTPEQLLDVFKAAALSVTKLYKTSAAAQTKARSDGYQDCLDDLLTFLDKQNIGLSDGEGWQIRRWATERLDGRDAASQNNESEDEVDKQEPSNTDTRGGRLETSQAVVSQDVANNSNDDNGHNSNSGVAETAAPSSPQIAVPSQDNFTFQSTMPYPQDSDLNMANLDLSDSRGAENTSRQANPQQPRIRPSRSGPRQRTSNHLGRGAGQKRKLNFAEIFDLGSIGGKDMFGGGGKRGRHA
jgi:hypothetical protein